MFFSSRVVYCCTSGIGTCVTGKVPFFQKRGINQCAISIHNAACTYDHNEIVVVEASSSTS